MFCKWVDINRRSNFILKRFVKFTDIYKYIYILVYTSLVCVCMFESYHHITCVIYDSAGAVYLLITVLIL